MELNLDGTLRSLRVSLKDDNPIGWIQNLGDVFRCCVIAASREEAINKATELYQNYLSEHPDVKAEIDAFPKV